MLLNIILLFTSSLLLTPSVSNGAKILAAVPTASFSHQVAFRPIWKELSLRGHQVTLITTDPIKDKALTNLTEIDISDQYDLLKELNYREKLLEIEHNMFKLFNFFSTFMDNSNTRIYNHPQVKKMIDDQSVKFDLVMVEYLNLGMVPFGHRFKAPLIGLVSFEAPYIGHECVGNPNHPVTNPERLLPFEEDLSFVERIISTVSAVMMKMYNTFYFYEKYNEIIKRSFGEGYPSIEKLTCSVDMVFVNVNNVFDTIRPNVPAVISFGGSLHGDVKPLPEVFYIILIFI